MRGRSYCNPCANKLLKAEKVSKAEVTDESETLQTKGKSWRKQIVSAVLKTVGWVLLIAFAINLIYSILAIVGTKHTMSDIIWQIMYSAFMVWLGAWLITREKRPAEAADESRFKGIMPQNLVLRRVRHWVG